jgi:hypothetical protein
MIETIDAQKIVDEFMAELGALMEKYDVEFESGDHFRGYPEGGQDIRIIAEFKDWRLGDIDFGQNIDRSSLLTAT